MTDSRQKLSEAAQAESEGRVADALRCYRAVLVTNPREPEALLGVGRVCLLLGDFERALEDFTAVLVDDPRCAEAYRGRGLAFLNQGLDGHALRDLSRAVELAPAAVEPSLSRGLAALELNDLPLAERDLRHAARLAPFDPDVLFGLAECVARGLVEPGESAGLVELRELLDRLAALGVEDALCDVLRAVVLVAEGDRDSARDLLAEALTGDDELAALMGRLPLLAD